MRAVTRALIFCALTPSCIPKVKAVQGAPAAQGASAVQGAAVSAGSLKPIHTVNEVPVPAVDTASEPVLGFMRGINLGNGLDAPSEGAWGVVLKPEHFAMAKAAGLDHVRLPVRFSAHAAVDAPYAIDEAFLKRVDWAVAQAAAHGLSIVIDLHNDLELMKKPLENADRLAGMWQQIALHYKDAPASVAFELINEPCDALKPDLLNGITKRALAAVRATNPTRIVFADSYFWASADKLQDLELPQDANLVPSFHMYQPILLTHQGMSWMGPEFQTRGIVFPGPPAEPVTPLPAAAQTEWTSTWFKGYNSLPVAENPGGPKSIFDLFKVVEAYLKSSHRRVYMGEWGIADSVDPTSRENWLRIVRQEAERRHIGWALWDDGGRFRAMNVADGTWTAPIAAGLFH